MLFSHPTFLYLMKLGILQEAHPRAQPPLVLSPCFVAAAVPPCHPGPALPGPSLHRGKGRRMKEDQAPWRPRGLDAGTELVQCVEPLLSGEGRETHRDLGSVLASACPGAG